MQKATLKRCLVELYAQFRIDWDTDILELEAKDFPVFTDLYLLLKSRAEEQPGEIVYKELLTFSTIWYTELTVLSGMGTAQWQAAPVSLVLDTHALSGDGRKCSAPSISLIMLYNWRLMSWDRSEQF